MLLSGKDEAHQLGRGLDANNIGLLGHSIGLAGGEGSDMGAVAQSVNSIVITNALGGALLKERKNNFW